jgi:hypothetical protein
LDACDSNILPFSGRFNMPWRKVIQDQCNKNQEECIYRGKNRIKIENPTAGGAGFS